MLFIYPILPRYGYLTEKSHISLILSFFKYQSYLISCIIWKCVQIFYLKYSYYIYLHFITTSCVKCRHTYRLLIVEKLLLRQYYSTNGKSHTFSHNIILHLVHVPFYIVWINSSAIDIISSHVNRELKNN